MIGAVIGDIVGSRFEWNNIKTKDFKLLTEDCFFTDDTVMTLAVAKSLLDCDGDYEFLSEVTVANMKDIGQPYPNCGYGGSFYQWMYSDDSQPYNSYGNGAAMRVSAVGLVATTIDQVKELSKKVTKVTHNHVEGLKGAEATAIAVYFAKEKKSKQFIKDYLMKHYYPMGKSLDEIRVDYQFNETCQETVPQALQAFFESTSFEDAIRNAISIGGDSDTVAAITGGVAAMYYGIPAEIIDQALPYLDNRLLYILQQFNSKYPTPII